MSVFSLSKPTKTQVIHGAERTVAVFVVAAFGQWALSNYSLDGVALHAAILAGVTALYQSVASLVTKL